MRSYRPDPAENARNVVAEGIVKWHGGVTVDVDHQRDRICLPTPVARALLEAARGPAAGVQMRRIHAPFSDRQVETLKRWQAGWFELHPYTCGDKRHEYPHGPRPILLAHTDGWSCPDPNCDYTQTWALFAVNDVSMPDVPTC